MTALRRVIRMQPAATQPDDEPALFIDEQPPPSPELEPAAEFAKPVVALLPQPLAENPRPEPKPAGPQAAPAPAAAIARFIDLENAFRQARDKDALRLAFVNGARQVAAYDHAILLECAPTPLQQARRPAAPVWKAVAASDIGKIDASTRLSTELCHLLAALERDNRDNLLTAQLIDLGTAAAGVPLLAGLAEMCTATPHMHWLPLKAVDGALIGGLVTFHVAPPTEANQTFLKGLALPYSHAWSALEAARHDVRGRLARWLGTARRTHALPIIAALVLIAPVRFSVLAPAEVVGAQPILIAAPLDGFVQDVHVSPGDLVKPGQTLISFVDTKLRNDVEVARKTHAAAFAKYQRALHTAVANHRDNHEIAIAKADAEVAEAQLALAEDMLNRSRAVAPEGGIAVFAARGDWLGRPVATGERILEIVDPADVQIRVDLPVADGVAFETGASLKVFLDGQPLGALDASLATMSYRPVANAENQMVYRLHAALPEGKLPPRLGARGTARIDGPYVPLGFYLFRRPFAALRQKLGL